MDFVRYSLTIQCEECGLEEYFDCSSERPSDLIAREWMFNHEQEHLQDKTKEHDTEQH